MKLKDLIDDKFIHCLEILADAELAVEVSFKVLDIKEKVISGTDKFLTLRKTLLDRFGKKDAEGKAVVDVDKGEYVIENQDGFDKAYADLINLDIDIPMLSRADFKGAKLSANVLKHLKVIITT